MAGRARNPALSSALGCSGGGDARHLRPPISAHVRARRHAGRNNTATVAGDQDDPAATNDTSTATTRLDAAPDGYGGQPTGHQQLRLRAARNPARLDVERPTIRNGRRSLEDTVSAAARGVIRYTGFFAERIRGETRVFQVDAQP